MRARPGEGGRGEDSVLDPTAVGGQDTEGLMEPEASPKTSMATAVSLVFSEQNSTHHFFVYFWVTQ